MKRIISICIIPILTSLHKVPRYFTRKRHFHWKKWCAIENNALYSIHLIKRSLIGDRMRLSIINKKKNCWVTASNNCKWRPWMNWIELIRPLGFPFLQCSMNYESRSIPLFSFWAFGMILIQFHLRRLSHHKNEIVHCNIFKSKRTNDKIMHSC